ncbi:hypothetical protein CDAR_13171, partial [Caerostris darwini]
MVLDVIIALSHRQNEFHPHCFTVASHSKTDEDDLSGSSGNSNAMMLKMMAGDYVHQMPR